jgi:hypothetical protein
MHAIAACHNFRDLGSVWTAASEIEAMFAVYGEDRGIMRAWAIPRRIKGNGNLTGNGVMQAKRGIGKAIQEPAIHE